MSVCHSSETWCRTITNYAMRVYMNLSTKIGFSGGSPLKIANHHKIGQNHSISYAIECDNEHETRKIKENTVQCNTME